MPLSPHPDSDIHALATPIAHGDRPMTTAPRTRSGALAAAAVCAFGALAMGCGLAAEDEGASSGRDSLVREYAEGSTVVTVRTVSSVTPRTVLTISRDGGLTRGPEIDLGVVMQRDFAIAADGTVGAIYCVGSVHEAPMTAPTHETRCMFASAPPEGNQLSEPVDVYGVTGWTLRASGGSGVTLLALPAGGWLTAYTIKGGDSRGWFVRRSDDGRMWSGVPGAARVLHEFDDGDHALISCRGNATRPAILAKSASRTWRALVGSSDGERWDGTDAIDIVGHAPGVEAPIPGRPELEAPDVVDCAWNGDTGWMLVSATRIGHREPTLWGVTVSLEKRAVTSVEPLGAWSPRWKASAVVQNGVGRAAVLEIDDDKGTFFAPCAVSLVTVNKGGDPRRELARLENCYALGGISMIDMSRGALSRVMITTGDPATGVTGAHTVVFGDVR